MHDDQRRRGEQKSRRREWLCDFISIFVFSGRNPEKNEKEKNLIYNKEKKSEAERKLQWWRGEKKEEEKFTA